MTAFLAVLSALLVGGADFVGGVASRRADGVRVAALAQVAGLAIAVPAAVVVGWEAVTAADATWSVLSGLAVGLGLALFYTAMARGTISLVAPVTAVAGAAVPVVYGLALGERPGTVTLIGIALAIAAVCLVSAAPGTGSGTRSSLVLAAGGGVLFGLFFVFISRTSGDAGLWPVALSRIGSAAALVALALLLSRSLAIPGRLAPAVAAIAALEVAAAVALLEALQRGPVSVASVLASLYPVSTTFLAWLLLHERLTRLQLAGVALALVAVALVSA